MATGYVFHPGGVMASSDVPYAGEDAWASVSGISPLSSLVGGPGHPDDPYNLPYNVDHARGRIVTQDAVQVGPAGGPGVHLLDDWRDLFNWKNSPAPWLLLLSLGVLGLMQFRLMVKAGRAKASAALG